MKMKKVVFLSAIAILTIFGLLSNAVNPVFASTPAKKNSLPAFLESYLEMQAAQANLTQAQLDQARALWVHQLSVRQAIIDSSSNGGVTPPAVSGDAVNPLVAYGSWMSTFIRPETYGGGVLYNQYNINGLPDGYFTEFYTPNSNGCGATVVGQMSSSNSHGFVYILAKIGPQALGHLGNYFIAEVSNDPNASKQQWINGFVGYAHITIGYGTPGAYYLLGSAPFSFSYIAIGAVVMAPPNDQDPFNDVMGDSVGSQYG